MLKPFNALTKLYSALPSSYLKVIKSYMMLQLDEGSVARIAIFCHRRACAIQRDSRRKQMLS